MMKFKPRFLTPLLLLPVCAAAWFLFSSQIAAWGLKTYCRYAAGADFSCNRVEKSKSGWTFEQPRLTLNDGFSPVSARFMTVSPAFFSSGAFLNVRVDVSEAVIDTSGRREEMHALFKRAHPGAETLRLANLDLRSAGGRVVWDEDSERKQAFFEWRKNPNEPSRFQLDLSGQNQGDNSAVFNISRDPGGSSFVRGEFNRLSCQALYRVLSSLGFASADWVVTDGVIDGAYSGTIPRSGPPLFSGKGTVSQFKFAQTAMGIQGQIGQAVFQIDESGESSTCIGRIRLNGETGVAICRGETPLWELKDLSGSVAFNGGEGIQLFLGGASHFKQRVLPFKLTGDVHLADQTLASLDMGVLFEGADGHQATARFTARQFGASCNSAEIELQNVGEEEFLLVQSAIEPYDQRWSHLVAGGGTLDASGIVYLQGVAPTEIHIDTVAAHDLLLSYSPWCLDCRMEHGEGAFFVNLAHQAPIETIDADLKVQDVGLSFPGFNERLWQLSGLSTDFKVSKGMIQKSTIRGGFAGLTGAIDIDWQSQDQIAFARFQGRAEELARIAPLSMQNGLESRFLEDTLSLEAKMKRRGRGAKIEGALEFCGKVEETPKTVLFGFDLEKCSDTRWQEWPIQEEGAVFWENLGYESMTEVLPALAFPSALLEANWIKSESGVLGFLMRNGWFYAHHLPVDKFVQPFVFPAGEFQLKGEGNFKGYFDHNTMAVDYELQKFSMENRFLLLDAGKVKKGCHFFDFNQKVDYGALPLADAVYLDKTSGLLFKEVNGTVVPEGVKVHLPEVSLLCEGAFFVGSVDFDYGRLSRGIYNVEISSHTLIGKVSQVQKIFQRFYPDHFLSGLGFEGEVSFVGNGGKLFLDFSPKGCKAGLKAEGEVKEGRYLFEGTRMRIDEVELGFVYDSGGQTFHVNPAYGSVVVGALEEEERYSFTADRFHFSSLEKMEGDFDVWAGDKARDIVRVKGESMINASRLLELRLDRDLTHFGEVRPDCFHLTYQPDGRIEEFELKFAFSLQSVMRDLQRLIRTGVISDSKRILNNLSGIKKGAGDFNVSLSYGGRDTYLHYMLEGDRIAADDHVFSRALLKGKTKGGRWIVDKLMLDDFSFSADLHKQDSGWDIHFLGVQFGAALLLGFEQGFLNSDYFLKGKIKWFETDLEALGEWPLIRSFVTESNIKGKVKGSGKLNVELFTGKQGVSAEASLDAAIRYPSFNGMSFRDLQNVSMHIDSKRGISIKNLQTHLLDASDAEQVSLNIKELDYSFKKGDLLIERAAFSVPSQNLPWFSKWLMERYPNWISASAAEMISALKKSGELKGELNFESVPPYSAVRLELADGTWDLFGGVHQLQNLTFEYDPIELKASAKYRLQDRSFWITAKTAPEKLKEGDLFITQEMFELDRNPAPLRIRWEQDPDYGLSVVRVDGEFSGIECALERDPLHPISPNGAFLTGKATVCPDRAAALFSESARESMEAWGCGGKYSLNGKWTLLKNGENPLHFSGRVSGEEVKLKGYRIDYAMGDVDASLTRVRVRDFKIRDQAAGLQADEWQCYKTGEGKWFLKAPRLNAMKFRPSALCRWGKKRPRVLKPLVLKQTEVKDFQGYLGDAASFTAWGKTQFQNRVKKRAQNPLFQIPGEILSRIGLDLSVLNPVSGSVEWRLGDGKVYFLKLKDAHSEGKLSKFYLANGSSPSWMDFNGDLDVRIKMKQHNLLFKLAELFTVTIQGNIAKPVYSLQKQK